MALEEITPKFPCTIKDVKISDLEILDLEFLDFLIFKWKIYAESAFIKIKTAKIWSKSVKSAFL